MSKWNLFPEPVPITHDSTASWSNYELIHGTDRVRLWVGNDRIEISRGFLRQLIEEIANHE